MRVLALLCRPPKCIRFLSLSVSLYNRVLSLWATILALIYRAGRDEGRIRICGEFANSSTYDQRSRRRSREKLTGNIRSRRVSRRFAFRLERESARGDTARCSPFPAATEATHVARRSFVIRQIAFLPRARGAKCVCDARTRFRARLVHLSRGPGVCYARKIIIILTVRAASNQRDSTFSRFLFFL